MPKNFPAIAYILLIVLALIWGSSFILIKRGLDVFSPGEVGAIRILAAAIFLIPISVFRLKKINKNQWKLLLFVGLVGSFIPAFLFAKAQTQIDSSIAGILNALTPLFVMSLGAFFFKQVITRNVALGLAIGFLGTIFLMLAGSGTDITEINYYALFIVVATICYGANVNLIKFKISDIDAKSITSVSLLIVSPLAALYLFVATQFVHKIRFVDGAVISLGFVSLLGIMGTAIALVLFNHLVKITTPIFTSSVTYLIPIIAVMWGILDGETLLIGHYLGMAAIIFGVFLANRKQRNKSLN